MRGRAVIIVALGLVGGSGCPSAPPETSEDGETGVALPPAPSFVAPASLELTIEASRDEALRLPIADWTPSTIAEFDGATFELGTEDATALELGAEGGAAFLQAGDELIVPLAGGLVVGEHSLVLVRPFEGETLRSESLRIIVEPSVLGSLTVSETPEPLALAPAGGLGESGLFAHGRGDDFVLGLRAGADARVWLGDAWLAGASGEVLALPGASTEIDAAIVDRGDHGRALVVAWLVGSPATEVRASLWALADEGAGPFVVEPSAPVLDAALVWDLDDDPQNAALGPHETRRLDGVAVLADTVFAALTARRDAESVTPGDAALISRRIDDAAALQAALVHRGSGSRDLDLPDSAVRLPTPFAEGAPRLSLRLARAFPISVENASNGLPRIVEGEAIANVAIAAAPTWMRTLDGSLGARHSFASTGAVAIDGWLGIGGQDGTPLPDQSPAVGLLAGVPTLVFPQGDAPTLVARSTGEPALVTEALDALRCEAVVAWTRGERSEPGGALASDPDRLPLACLRDGELRLAVLSSD